MTVSNPGENKTLDELEYSTLKRIVIECICLIHNAGLLDQLSMYTRDVVATDQEIAQAILSEQGPSLDLRLSLEESLGHILKVFRPPAAQHEFYKTIVKVCYILMSAEKNPLIAQELRGVLRVNETLEKLMKM